MKKIEYEVRADNSILSRPDKRFLNKDDAVTYALELRSQRFDNIRIIEHNGDSCRLIGAPPSVTVSTALKAK